MTYGGATLLWSLTLTPAEANSADYGVAIVAVESMGTANTAYVLGLLAIKDSCCILWSLPCA